MSIQQSSNSDVTDKLSIVQKKNTYEIILEQLEELILSGSLESGQKLPGERVLSEKFGASRNSVRVALKLLEFMNLLEVRPGSGVYVTSKRELKQARLNSRWAALLKQHPLIELIEARQCIEPFIAGLAAQNAEDEEILEMKMDLKQMEIHLADDDKAMRNASSFHELLFKSSHNIILAQIGLLLNNLMDESKKISWTDHDSSFRSLEEHKGILEAIDNRDKEMATQKMFEHLECVKDHLIEAGLFHK